MQLIIGIESLTLTKNDIKRLANPAVGGVILFARNYQNPTQLLHLTHAIRDARTDIFISVDHEGGRVQRFREGFTTLPSAKQILNYYRHNPEAGLHLAHMCGLVIAVELQKYGIDLSYAPVLDIDYHLSEVIGDRSFGSLTQDLIALTSAIMAGMHEGGMAAVGKHFPGHGGVIADTHGEIAIDPRPLSYLWNADLLPFKKLIQNGLEGIMPAHVIYPKVDNKPAGFSRIWLQDILRDQLNFQGAIISDDLGMAGAQAVGRIHEQLKNASTAGCDFALLCNDFGMIDQALQDTNIFYHAKNSYKTQLVIGKYIHELPSHLLQEATKNSGKINTLLGIL